MAKKAAKPKRDMSRFVGQWYDSKWVGTWDPKTQRILPPTEEDMKVNAAVEKERRRLAGPQAAKEREKRMREFEERMSIPASAIKHVGTWDPKTGRVIPDERTEVD